MTAVILDCYTVEPSGLGVPPYLSTYVRDAYCALAQTHPDAAITYVTIDDVRARQNGPSHERDATDPMTYSASVNRDQALELLARASVVVVVAGDKVPSVHLHAVNGSMPEIAAALMGTRGRRVLLGPMSAFVPGSCLEGVFDAIHTHTITAAALLHGSGAPATYPLLRLQRRDLSGLVAQLRWTPIAEIELYRGCTRRQFCSFCNEPVKNPVVTFRDVEDVLDEVSLLYRSGVRDFRLGQQTCFFSYKNRDAEAVERLLSGIRESCPDIDVLHIDNADPLAVASRSGARIARLVATYCSDGNCAAMGQESFDPAVIARNNLTSTPDILRRAVENVNEAGSDRGPHGLPKLLPGINLVYGMPGETPRTHDLNLRGLARMLDDGQLCHRTNVRRVQRYPGTPLGEVPETTTNAEFEACKAQIAEQYEVPMKRRVYPTGLVIRDLHSFFVTERGTWHRRLGSYSIQVVERGVALPLFVRADLRIVDHAGRYAYGERAA